MRLLDILFPPRVDERTLRDVSESDFLALLAPRIVPGMRPETVALLPFDHPSVRAAVHEAKYHEHARAFKLLALVLADYLRDHSEALRTAVVVPMPLGRARRRARGFNQVEEVARRAVKELGMVVDATLLERTRETPSQVSLPRHAREENMRNAFRGARDADPAHTYILVDDVVTTGATLEAAVLALRAAGATSIIPLALAH